MTEQAAQQELSEMIERKMRQALRDGVNLKQTREKNATCASEDEYVLAWSENYERPASERIELSVIKEFAAKYKIKPRVMQLEPAARALIYGLIAARARQYIQDDRLGVEAFINSLGTTPPPSP